jgi:hypothetical protein
MPQRDKTCVVCRTLDAVTVNRFLVMDPRTPGKRGPRSLAPVFGLDRRDIAIHAKKCLVGERRAKVEADLSRLGGSNES